jgi:hypothetical protein
MTRRWLLVMAMGLLGCTTRYYVADVHHEGSHLVMTKCELDFRGVATHYCHKELVADERN